MVQANGFSGSGIISGPAALTVEAGGGGGGYAHSVMPDAMSFFAVGGGLVFISPAPFGTSEKQALFESILIGTVITISGITGPASVLNGTTITKTQENNPDYGTYGHIQDFASASLSFTDAWDSAGLPLPEYNVLTDAPGFTFNWN